MTEPIPAFPFRPLRRADQELSRAEAEAVLREAKTAVLALSGDGGFPYAVPVNPLYHEGKIFFHSAPAGHKIDAVRRCGRVSLCIVAQDEVLPEKLTTAYRSVIVFGRARIVDQPDELRRIAELIGMKYAPEFPELCRRAVDRALGARKMVCVEITVDHLTGKCGRQVLLRRQEKNNKTV